jgi:hypothetical protein
MASRKELDEIIESLKKGATIEESSAKKVC